MKNFTRDAAMSLLISVSALLTACAFPVENLWPPPPDSAARTVYVSLDTWHAMIAFPQSEEMTVNSAHQEEHQFPQLPSSLGHVLPFIRNQRFEEWGYAERAWYLEGRWGLTGVMRALFWPTEGVVEVGWYDQVWANRTPQPPSDLFIFRLSEEGYQRLRHHLDATIADRNSVTAFGTSLFYPAKRSYHALHTCHQYAAYALREAGLPLSPFWAFSRASFAWQLHRAVRIAEKQPTAIPHNEPQ
ncbi:DUF2459 domain-containing protein [Nitrosomonas communis]|uniref:Lipoprotein n=1 Tax=Nitrosomonas communis TaxID=44574 RepID=A0A1I4KL12_9PROT|nr:DUF2459 domain-containing protein [Nitrosomonas communis]SFL79458.1 Protein of unknown function [Nitrosomonas communis]